MTSIGPYCIRKLAINVSNLLTLDAAMEVSWWNWANCFPKNTLSDWRFAWKCPIMWWIVSKRCVHCTRINTKTSLVCERTQWSICRISSTRDNYRRYASCIQIHTLRKPNTSGESSTQRCWQNMRIVYAKTWVSYRTIAIHLVSFFSFIVFFFNFRCWRDWFTRSPMWKTCTTGWSIT